MNIYEDVVGIFSKYARDQDALAKLTNKTDILDELQVDSARLIDITFELEDKFDLEICDNDIDSIVTIGDAVSLIRRLL
jgi:acyl carrier protein